MQLVNTIVFKPRGRGKIERFFRTLVQMFCPTIASQIYANALIRCAQPSRIFGKDSRSGFLSELS